MNDEGVRQSVEDAPPIIWNFYTGAYGPSILVALSDQAAVVLVRNLLQRVGALGVGIDVGLESRMRLVNMWRLELGRSVVASEKTLWQREPGRFLWSCSREKWLLNAAMLEPFRAGERGHQYLTAEGIDDALIEVSFGESHP